MNKQRELKLLGQKHEERKNQLRNQLRNRKEDERGKLKKEELKQEKVLELQKKKEAWNCR